MHALGYPPHFTFAIYDTCQVSEEDARNAIERAAEAETQVRVTFNSIRSFEGPPLVLWADPDSRAQLDRIHQRIHAVISPLLCRSHYRPRFWKPHCTLGTSIRDDRRADALAYARRFRGGLHAVFDAIDCMSFPPLRRTAERHLRAV